MSVHLSIGDCILVKLTSSSRKGDVQNNSEQCIGLIKYMGMIHDQQCLMRQYIGIELLQPIPNGHDGIIDGYHYFDAPIGHGIHIPIHQVIRKLSVAEIFKKLQKATKKDEKTNNINPLYLKTISMDNSVDSAYIFPTRSRHTTLTPLTAPSSPSKTDPIIKRKWRFCSDGNDFDEESTKTSTGTDTRNTEDQYHGFDEETHSEYSDSDSESTSTASSDPCYSNIDDHDTLLDPNSFKSSFSPAGGSMPILKKLQTVDDNILRQKSINKKEDVPLVMNGYHAPYYNPYKVRLCLAQSNSIPDPWMAYKQPQLSSHNGQMYSPTNGTTKSTLSDIIIGNWI